MSWLCKIFGCRWHVRIAGLSGMNEYERLRWHGLVRVCQRCGRLERFHFFWKWEHYGEYITPDEIKELIPIVFNKGD